MTPTPRSLWLAGLLIVAATAHAEDGLRPSPPYKLPRDRAAWKEARQEIRRELRASLGGLLDRASVAEVRWLPETEEHRGCAAIEIDGTAGLRLKGLFAPIFPERDPRGSPVLIYLHGQGTGRSREILRPGPTGRPIVEEFRRFGFAVLCIDSPLPDDCDPWTSPEQIQGKPAWTQALIADLLGVEALETRGGIDTSRIAVLGHGLGAARALWLTALDDRVKCGFAVGNVTRISDYLAATGKSPAPWAAKMLESFDVEAVAALGSPRGLSTFAGTADRSAPFAGVEVIRETYEKARGLAESRDRIPCAQFTYGDIGGEFTLLEWDSMMEFLDKALLPQGPTPLPHDPEPEPKPDARFANLAEFGIAGWVPEMSQRPGTWTWKDGVIACKPGNNEYGWLRAPIEVGDFVLSLDWKVPKDGNSGIFLRSRPVFWTLPSTEAGNLLVSARGLEWPSRTGFELQAADGFGGPSKYSTGSLYRHAAPCAVPIKPAGEWNHYTVRARGERFEIWLNGEQIQDTKIGDLPTLRQLPMRGYIGLQNHGNGAEFRNVFYRKLEPGDSP